MTQWWKDPATGAVKYGTQDQYKGWLDAGQHIDASGTSPFRADSGSNVNYNGKLYSWSPDSPVKEGGIISSAMAQKPSPNQMSTDFNAYFDTSKEGDSKQWAGGTLTRTAQGATYTGPDGKPITMNKGADLNQLALSSPGIANEWKSAYGFSPQTPTQPSTTGAVSAQTAPGGRPQMEKDYQAYFASSKPGDVRSWGGGTLTRTASGAIYTGPDGKQLVLKPDSDLNQLALSSPGIASEWKSVYGWSPTTPEVKPDTSYQPENTPATDPSTATDLMVQSDPNQTVEGRLQALLRQNSQYLQAARAGADRTANRRGLLNSSIAAEAGEKAAIEAALPIAQADAAAAQQNLNTAQQGMIQSKLSSQGAAQTLRQQAEQFKQQAALYRVQGDINMALQAEANAAALIKQSQAAEQASVLSTQNFNQQSALSAGQYAHETAKQNSDQAWNMLLKEAEFNHDADRWGVEQKDSFGRVAVTLQTEYSANRTAILTNKELKGDAKTKALNDLDRSYVSSLGIIASAYGVELDIDKVSSDIATTPDTYSDAVAVESVRQQYGLTQTDVDGYRMQWQNTGTNIPFSTWLSNVAASRARND